MPHALLLVWSSIFDCFDVNRSHKISEPTSKRITNTAQHIAEQHHIAHDNTAQ